MFIPTHAAPGAGSARLERLRLSLNTPVVAIDAFPVGPAAASIAVHGLPGACRLVLALRSVRTGQIAFFEPESTGPVVDVDLAEDAAVGFAEALGFLFDDDLVAADPDGRTARLGWRAFLAEPELPEDEFEGPVRLSKFRFCVAVDPDATQEARSS